ncbi:M48 family metallopeptidase [Martelella lutilitoris]|uniref:M48 family metallopeptidase n=1 Tax=Martelella lutilitoris TaxID=2583532 RepID=A0A5C4JW45_9HYPH|nr:SprT family zinc-dependent metalloprotease [Martelella lutilitoris]TNB49688.1 M48 family metallopeptidase [Martelella lutilitoris]
MANVTTHNVELAGQILPYALKRSSRKTLTITVFPDGGILVAAPASASVADIDQRLRQRGRWILRTRRAFEQFRPITPPRRYLPGETHRYLGRQYRLSVEQSLRSDVTIEGDRIAVKYPGMRSAERTEQLLTTWFQHQSRQRLLERLTSLSRAFPEYGDPPRLTVRKLTKRWGSMSQDGSHMLLNTRLIEAPIDCIDYVIIHELCHVREPNHGPAFFELLEQKLPDWERRKLRLEKIMV